MKKSKFTGERIIRILKEVEAGMTRLKRMYADLALEHHALKHVLLRKG